MNINVYKYITQKDNVLINTHNCKFILSLQKKYINFIYI